MWICDVLKLDSEIPFAFFFCFFLFVEESQLELYQVYHIAFNVLVFCLFVFDQV